MDQPLFSLPHAQNLDRAAHAALGRVTQGLSPASLAVAFTDWWMHLALAPGKQMQLAEKAQRKAARLGRAALTCLQPAYAPCIEPLEQDDRFDAPAWQNFPYNLIYQAFLLNQQWWYNATTEVHGVDKHHQDVVTFTMRQVLDMFSPSNFFLTNPEVQEATLAEGGANLARGWQRFVADWIRYYSGERDPSLDRFRPGHEVAVTPGQVVMRNELVTYTPGSTGNSQCAGNDNSTNPGHF